MRHLVSANEAIRASARRRTWVLFHRARESLRQSPCAQREAISLLEEACRSYPFDAHSWLALSQAFMSLQEMNEAELVLSQALMCCPRSVHLLHASGVYMAETNRPKEAVQFFDRALELDSQNAHTLHSLARLALRNGKNAQAFSLLNNGSSTQIATPKRQEALLLVEGAELAVAQGRLSKREAFDQFVEEASRRRALGRASEAARLERAAAKLADDTATSLACLRRATQVDGSIKSTLALVRFLLLNNAIPRNNIQEKNALAAAAEMARQHIRQTLSLLLGARNNDKVSDADARLAHELLAKLEWEYFGEFENAKAILERARRRWPGSWQLEFETALIFRKQRNLVSATTHLQNALKCAKSDTKPIARRMLPRILTTAAVVAAEVGDRQRSHTYFDQCHRLEPYHGAAYAAEADCAWRIFRDVDAARRALRKGLITLNRSNDKAPKARYAPTLWHNWGTLEARRGDYVLARKLFQRGLFEISSSRSRADTPLLLHSLASLELRLGRFDDAANLFLKAASLTSHEKAAPCILGAARARLKAEAALSSSLPQSQDDEWPSNVVATIRLLLSLPTQNDHAFTSSCQNAHVLKLRTRLMSGGSWRELFAAAVLADPGDGRAWRLWASAENRKGTRILAGRVLEAAKRLARAPDPALASLIADFAQRPTQKREAFAVAALQSASGSRELEALVLRFVANQDKERLWDQVKRRKSAVSVHHNKKRAVSLLLARWADLELKYKNGSDSQSLDESFGVASRLASAAVSADSNCPEALFAVGKCLEANHKLDAADKAYAQALQVAPDLSRCALALAQLRSRRRDFDGARSILAAGLDASPTDAGAAAIWHHWAALEAQLGNLDGLATLHKRAQAAGDFFWRRSDFIDYATASANINPSSRQRGISLSSTTHDEDDDDTTAPSS
eukprot:CAMPEP_0197318736 /NCGR_PEP_ID=MMETSP0891-20130614/52265_1 /TAXON_ID=44058 ORGANISM="Aureoumbra lagunensis, Strain CCMP1510" /NCGR_SAMPLE_ID=MMETSP0891 /ASSEMBLY_ACC=CAM_ASM_000534 /LENGTH=914 /DNA_ID=CAMNT_0042809339 /DNA_START=189 /DNA_END=2933 /DNA_ORIENTATION=+